MTEESKLFCEFIYCACGCGKTRSKYVIRNVDKNVYRKDKTAKFINHHHTKLMQFGENNPAWKGGRKKESHGYVLILKPDHPYADKRGYVREHRLIYEEYYKCCLLPWIDIHHKNIGGLSKRENKHDNRIDNLEAMTKGEHMRLHKKKCLA